MNVPPCSSCCCHDPHRRRLACRLPLDMRAAPDTVLARVVQVFGAARPHHAYCFANKRADRMKVLVHDGIGLVAGGASPALVVAFGTAVLVPAQTVQSSFN